jgi:hypothetical protein
VSYVQHQSKGGRALKQSMLVNQSKPLSYTLP